MTPWADGPSLVSQCPIQPSGSYTYRFGVPGQEGTLWWHAHSSFLRATVYGAFIVRPRAGNAYPFPAPDMEVPIVLGKVTAWRRPPVPAGRTSVPCWRGQKEESDVFLSLVDVDRRVVEPECGRRRERRPLGRPAPRPVRRLHGERQDRPALPVREYVYMQ